MIGNGHEGVIMILVNRVTMILGKKVTMILVNRVTLILGKKVTMILVENFESNLVDGDVSERAASAEDDRTRNHTRLDVITAEEQLLFSEPHHIT